VEVSEAQFDRVAELWDDPRQSDEPPFIARFANSIPLYSDAMSITGLVSLSDASNIPTFHMTEPRTHPFVVEQHAGVSPERVAEWDVLIYHPQSAQTGSARKPKRWWQFWR
jgi:hypothetical protein